jgi:hypothetical protein
MQDVNLYKSVTNIDPGIKGQGGSHGIIRIHVWSGFVTSERKEEEEKVKVTGGLEKDQKSEKKS